MSQQPMMLRIGFTEAKKSGRCAHCGSKWELGERVCFDNWVKRRCCLPCGQQLAAEQAGMVSAPVNRPGVVQPPASVDKRIDDVASKLSNIAAGIENMQSEIDDFEQGLTVTIERVSNSENSTRAAHEEIERLQDRVNQLERLIEQLMPRPPIFPKSMQPDLLAGTMFEGEKVPF